MVQGTKTLSRASRMEELFPVLSQYASHLIYFYGTNCVIRIDGTIMIKNSLRT